MTDGWSFAISDKAASRRTQWGPMFRALDTKTNDWVVIANYEREDIPALREKCWSGHIRCRGCGLEVIVKAGEILVFHFAHKADNQCPLEHQPGDVLNAQDALYRWLRKKFGDAVAIEHAPDGTDLSRPFDCWVETDRGRFAYWIVGKKITPYQREAVQNVAEGLGAKLHWVFLAKRLKQGRADIAKVGPIEREAIAEPTDYDRMHRPPDQCPWGSLHYINAKEKTFTTLRAISSRTASICKARIITTSLEQLLVSRVTGDPVHPQEGADVTRYREAELRRKEEQQRQEEQRCAAQRAILEDRRRRVAELGLAPKPPPLPTPAPPPVRSAWSLKWEATCVFCSKATTDWYRSEGGKKTCICKGCRSKDDGRAL